MMNYPGTLHKEPWKAGRDNPGFSGKDKENDKMEKKIIYILASCYFWFTLFFISAILFMISLLLFIFTAAFDRRRVILHRYSCIWSDIVLRSNPLWRVKVVGKRKIDPKTAYVMVSNHQSGADILVLFKLHTHFKWVAKKGLYKIPFLGWNMSLNGYISIERSKGRSKLMMMDRAATAVREGNSVMIFPEGTRSPDGQLQTFKTGAFRLALETGAPVLPIAISGTFHAIKKGGFTIHRNHDIRATVLDPIPYETIRELEPADLARKVHDTILSELRDHTSS
jgi:1-acyl-sn-glycerol-3-phosphate acyltransferase